MALVDRMTAAQIRTQVLAFINHTCAAAGALSGTTIEPGANIVRRRRWVISDTSVPGILVVVELALDGAAAYIGPAAAMRGVVPRAVRLAWLAAQYGETDDDPTD